MSEKDDAVRLFRYLFLWERDEYLKAEKDGKENQMNPAGYEVIIWWSARDARYVAEVPELEGCTADGESLREVAGAVEESINRWIAARRESGQEIPKPRGRLLYA